MSAHALKTEELMHFSLLFDIEVTWESNDKEFCNLANKWSSNWKIILGAIAGLQP